MKNILLPLVAAICILIPAAALQAADAPAVAKRSPYAVLEVTRFDVNREDFSSKEAERAGRIPDEVLDAIQRVLLTELTTEGSFGKVRKPDAAATEGPILELSGRVVDYLPGSKAARYFVGFGAGQQKVEVLCVLKDRATGAEVARATILDRKVGGVGGGSEDKGLRDFAEKVAVFIKEKVGTVAAAPPPPAQAQQSEQPQ